MKNLPNTVWVEQDIAVKKSVIRQKSDPEEEAATMAQFHHPNIINLMGVCRTQTHYYIVMPFMPNGALSSRFLQFTWSQIVHVLRGSALALKQLHDMDPVVLFRDFKSDNILLDEDFNAVICDFGAAGTSDKENISYTYGFADPKFVYKSTQPPTQDVYSFGVVLLQMIIQSSNWVTNIHGKYTVAEWAELEKKRQGHAVANRLLSKWWQPKGGASEADAVVITALGLNCVHNDVTRRPDIDGVIDILQHLTVY